MFCVRVSGSHRSLRSGLLSRMKRLQDEHYYDILTFASDSFSVAIFPLFVTRFVL